MVNTTPSLTVTPSHMVTIIRIIRHLISAVPTAANEASASEERSRSVGRESWSAAVKASAVNSHHYKRQVVTSN